VTRCLIGSMLGWILLMNAGCAVDGGIGLTSVAAPPATSSPQPKSVAMLSPNWCGYTVPTAGIDAVRADWNQPAIAGQPNANIYVWIGVGGWDATYNQLIQIGTLAYIYPDGHWENNDVWYETLPQNNQLTTLYVTPGDHMHAIMQLAPGSPTHWTLAITDVTSKRQFAINLTYPSSQAYADFIVEDPYKYIGVNAPQYPLPRFSPVTFTGADVRYGKRWVPLAALSSLIITLQQNGIPLATAGPIIGDDAFTVTRTIQTASSS
jgi:hypothetical protein